MNEDFEKVVRDNTGLIYGLCFRLTGETTEAEDLCQETFAKAYRAYGKFEGRSQVSTWLYRIAVNSWKNRFRKKRLSVFRFFTLSSDDDETTVEFKSNETLPDESIEKKQSLALLHKGLRLLNEDDRLIVTLRDLEEKSYLEIASILNVPEGTVKSRLSRARESLRQKMIPLLKSAGEIS